MLWIVVLGAVGVGGAATGGLSLRETGALIETVETLQRDRIEPSRFSKLETTMNHMSERLQDHAASPGHTILSGQLQQTQFEVRQNSKEIADASVERKEATQTRQELKTRSIQIQNEVERVKDSVQRIEKGQAETKKGLSELRDIILRRLPRTRGAAPDLDGGR